MPQYRVFTNDRGTKDGVPKYSCLDVVNAADADAALTRVPKWMGQPPYLPAVAIEWPPTLPQSKAWIEKHV